MKLRIAIGICALATAISATAFVPPPYPIALAASAHTCALVSDGSIDCWGENVFGQAGVSGGASNVLSPQKVKGLAAPAVAIAAGNWHTCALLNTLTVQCWGLNDKGQLGSAANYGTSASNPIPQTVTNLAGKVLSIAAAANDTCAVVRLPNVTYNVVQCWGSNGDWQLGSNSIIGSAYIPQTIPFTAESRAVTVGASALEAFACSLAGPTVTCWGANYVGNLGRGFTSPHELPGKVPNLSAYSIHAGSNSGSVCAQDDAKTLQCWGQNNAGELGNGIVGGYSSMPVSVLGLYPASSYDGNVNHRCMINAGAVMCWGDNWNGELGLGFIGAVQTAPSISLIQANASSIATGGVHTCSIVNSTVMCWGGNDQGQLGNGSFTSSLTPTVVPLP